MISVEMEDVLAVLQLCNAPPSKRQLCSIRRVDG